ncbi:hypothetical protein ABZ345_35920 [Lentzea sp. NPDC005914]|uniref:hypothetical protein n=1 Tax=Lentzea sp. NPDC005914 TaxID=3154572 RepID=UPI0033EAD6BD
MRAKRTIAVTAALLGLTAVMVSPASAVSAGSWKAYGNTNPITSSPHNWVCASSQAVTTNVVAQVCTIRSSGGGSAQGAVIVRNNRAGLYSTTATVDLWTEGRGQIDIWECPSSGVAANSWSVCFGRSQSVPSTDLANSFGSAGSKYLGVSGPA